MKQKLQRTKYSNKSIELRIFQHRNTLPADTADDVIKPFRILLFSMADVLYGLYMRPDTAMIHSLYDIGGRRCAKNCPNTFGVMVSANFSCFFFCCFVSLFLAFNLIFQFYFLLLVVNHFLFLSNLNYRIVFFIFRTCFFALRLHFLSNTPKPLSVNRNEFVSMVNERRRRERTAQLRCEFLNV